MLLENGMSSLILLLTLLMRIDKELKRKKDEKYDLHCIIG
jgi:hypothetical protein